MTPPTQNLNSRPPSAHRQTASGSIGISWKASAIQSSSPPVRIVGARSRYQGGYRVNI